MSYTKLFDPPVPLSPAAEEARFGDREAQPVYVYQDDIVLAVNVALATTRPLLVRGEPGTGKSSLAAHIAKIMAWRFYGETISSQTRAQDLLWRFDAVRRLGDAQVKKGLLDRAAYIEPGVLWWAFDRDLATRRGLPQAAFDNLKKAQKITAATDPCRIDHSRAVVLLDEIDKADPDVPNNLLVPLGSYRFVIEELATANAGEHPEVAAKTPPLVVITTNEERELPRAFLRRCVTINLEYPKPGQLVDHLVAIAKVHFPAAEQGLFKAVAGIFKQLREEQRKKRLRLPSTAEYLDAISACRELHIQPDSQSELWQQIATAVLCKPPPDL